ncbi:hypothetical protein [Deinococcus yunweiensis]|uniref:hypothetical protein n=1 Tax=Deinococcus yunweiensis TaxID=367282 RepID=UPI00398E3C3E
MNVRSLCMCSVVLAVGGAAGAQCVKTPTHAFNGLVRITYPSGGGTALLQQVCDVGSQQLRADVLANARARNVPVTWVEVYGTRNWGSTFHDLIYKTRALGYGQASYSKYNVLPATQMSGAEFLVYANKNGKYIAMGSRREGTSTANAADVFIVYGN